MSDELDFDLKSAGKFLANLEQEYKGIESTINILRTVSDAKRVINGMESLKKKLETDIERYEELTAIAKRDAEDAEAFSLNEIDKAEANKALRTKQIEEEIAGLEKKIEDKRSECDSKCAGFDADVKEKAKWAYETIEKSNKEAQDAITRKEQALQALEKVGMLVGGRT